MNEPQVLDQHGQVVPSTKIANIKALASSYQAASLSHQDMATWRPFGASGQAAMGFDREIVASRIHDIARNDGWASGGIDRLVDNVIGAGWRLSAEPNEKSLGISEDEANELADNIESEFEDYANDLGFWCDAGRRGPLGSVLALGFRHRILDGEALGAILWLDRGGDYATAMQNIDPDRLSTPMGKAETANLRSGIVLDTHGAATAYHFRTRHPGEDVYLGGEMNRWERVARETSWGRPKIVHAFEANRAGTFRGVSPLAPILRKLKQINKYDEVELQAATLNAVMTAFIESPFDHEQLADSLEGGELTDYQKARLEAYGKNPMKMPGAQMGFLFPGEKVNMTAANHPNAVFESFVRAALRNVASAMGMTYEQLTMDWSQVNYSSARAALLEVWRGLTARKGNFAAQYVGPFYAAWLEEAIDKGRVKLPKGAPPFADRRAAYCRADWIGPGRGWVDPQREADAAVTRIDGGLSTLQRECNEQGLDWKRVLQQQARERREIERLGGNSSQPMRAVLSRGQPNDSEESKSS